MAALASSIGSLHKDIRSESRGYKRDKDHSAKWIVGARPLAGVKRDIWTGEPTNGTPEQHAKVRPEKKSSDQYVLFLLFSQITPFLTNRHRSSYPKYHNNSLRAYDVGHASGRIARKADARAEVCSPNTMSRSLAELAPHNLPIKQARTPSVEAGILYSFDAKSSPRNGIGLDALVEKAEREWSNRETVKLVRNEYEMLDERGEVTVIREGKKGKKGSPKQRPQLVVAEDEDDWERI